MLTGDALQTVDRHLQGVGYAPSLLERDWTPRDVVHGETPVRVPLMAFWGKPFDQFRSAIAVMPKNGTLPSELARRTVSHVLMCEEDAAELWLLDAAALKYESRVPLSQLEGLFTACRGKIEPNNVAKTKIRLRQYALYEADPNGEAFGQWAVKPNIDQAGSRLERLLKDTKPQSGAAKPTWARWLFRVLTLRVGLDKGWPVASDLSPERVSDFVERAAEYPMRWHRGPPDHQLCVDITERVLSDLQHFDFKTVDPLFVSKAVGAASLKEIRSDIDLFPTPKPFAWDMMDSIPLTDEFGICDATAGTGTFLVAAGHSVWTNAVGATADLPDLRQRLQGSDSSAFSTDIAHMALDLAFGYEQSPMWAVKHIDAKQATAALPHDREWLLVGNPPWAAHGSSRNKAAEIMSYYVEALAARRRGWIAIILPRTVFTGRSRSDQKMREKISANFQIESAWELPYGTIPGGNAQATAVVLSRGNTTTTTVWKQLDTEGVVNTVGYNRPPHSRFYLPPHGRFFESKFTDSRRLEDSFLVRQGVGLKSRDLDPSPGDGAIPFVHKPSQIGNPDTGRTSRSDENEWPRSFTEDDAVDESGWVARNRRMPAREYRQSLERLPQIAIPRAAFEGKKGLCSSIAVVEKPTLFNDSFCILIPKEETSPSFAHGVAILLTSLFGRLWIHLHALSGRHILTSKLSDLPLLPDDQMENLPAVVGAGAYTRTPRPLAGWLFEPRNDFEQELHICSMYGLDERESAALLSLSYFLGHEPSSPKILRRQMAKMRKDPERVKELWDRVRTAEDAHERSELYIEALTEEEKDDYLVVESVGCQLSINKASIGSANG